MDEGLFLVIRENFEGQYLRQRNPGTLRAPITLFGGSFGSFPAKTGDFRYILLKYEILSGIMSNGVQFVERNVRKQTSLGGESRVRWGTAGAR